MNYDDENRYDDSDNAEIFDDEEDFYVADDDLPSIDW